MAESTPTRTDRRRAQTRENLTTAARELIAEHGVAGLRVGEVTERADVALGSFYNYFASKEEVIEAIVAETIVALAEGLEPLIETVEDPAEAVSVSVRRVIGLAYDDPQLAWLLVNLDRADARFETMVLPQAKVAFERGKKSGRFVFSDLHVALAVTVGGALAVMRGLLEERLEEGAEEAATEDLLRGLGVPDKEARELAKGDRAAK